MGGVPSTDFFGADNFLVMIEGMTISLPRLNFAVPVMSLVNHCDKDYIVIHNLLCTSKAYTATLSLSNGMVGV